MKKKLKKYDFLLTEYLIVVYLVPAYFSEVLWDRTIRSRFDLTLNWGPETFIVNWIYHQIEQEKYDSFSEKYYQISLNFSPTPISKSVIIWNRWRIGDVLYVFWYLWDGINLGDSWSLNGGFEINEIENFSLTISYDLHNIFSLERFLVK